MSTTWIRRLFLIAGFYGLVILPPQYFLEHRIGLDHPPAIAHPEYFYGFLGVTITWQLVYILIATDPLRYRPMMLLAALAKLSFTCTVATLYAYGRVPMIVCVFAAIDFLLAVLFLIAFARLGRTKKP